MIVHGKYSGYTAGCRCDPCKEQGRIYNHERYKQRQAAKRPTETNLRGAYQFQYEEGDTSWMPHRACAGVPTEVFYPKRGGNELAADAKAICAGCEVRRECLSYALRTRQTIGIWGGLSEYERRQIRRQAS